jgi:hypothetical protein
MSAMTRVRLIMQAIGFLYERSTVWRLSACSGVHPACDWHVKNKNACSRCVKARPMENVKALVKRAIEETEDDGHSTAVRSLQENVSV